MNQIDTILQLSTIDDQPFGEIIKKLFMEHDVREVHSVPGRMLVRDILADLRVHQQTTSTAGIKTTGISETIQRLEQKKPTEELLCFGFAVDSKYIIGNCYTNADLNILVGCVFVERKESRAL